MTGVDEVSDPAEAPPLDRPAAEGERPSASAAASETSGTSGRDPDDQASGTIDEGRRWWASELLLMLELGGLAAFAFGRPVLDTFGRSPDTFVARGANAATIVLFGLVVGVGPYLVFGLLGLLGRPFGPTVRRRVHIGLVGLVGGGAVWQIAQGITGFPPESEKAILAGVVGGVAVGFLRASIGSTASFLRFLGVASVVFLVQFLFMSPTSSLVTGDGPAIDDDVARQVTADLGDGPPDVVLVVFDALPTGSLLDGEGTIDAELFPNFARLAGTSSWYRNNTTVASATGHAVPAIFTGRFRDGDGEAGTVEEGDEDNLFTLLGGSYEMHVREQITRLCPQDVCTGGKSDGLGALLGDAVGTWSGLDAREDGDYHLPGALGRDRFDSAVDWAARQSPRTAKPQLYAHHVVLPHSPWYLTPEGETYQTVDKLPTGMGVWWGNNEGAVAVGVQRHILQLQAADALLGRLLDRLEADGRFDDSMIVVTADHGASFLPDQFARGLTELNMEQILWTPLLIKAPGQTAPEVDDSNVMSIDIVPTIADRLGLELPWAVDGVPIGERRDDTKVVQHHKMNALNPPEGENLLEIDDPRPRFETMLTFDQVEATGPDAVYRRTAHGDLFGRDVDDVSVAAATDETIAVDRLGDIEDSVRDDPLAEIVGDASLPPGTTVAYAVNGTIGAVTEVAGPEGQRQALTIGLVPPPLFRDGGNELTAYVVEGPVGSETLREVGVVDAG
jgi:hypothetical protein